PDVPPAPLIGTRDVTSGAVQGSGKSGTGATRVPAVSARPPRRNTLKFVVGAAVVAAIGTGYLLMAPSGGSTVGATSHVPPPLAGSTNPADAAPVVGTVEGGVVAADAPTAGLATLYIGGSLPANAVVSIDGR